MKRKLVIDLSGAGDIPEHLSGENIIIPCRVGRFQHQFDVLDENITAELREKLNNLSQNINKRREIPVGFNLWQLPEGAVVRPV